MQYVRLLALVLLVLLTTSYKPATFTVITYNVWNGFENETRRRNTFVQWARQQHADVIAFEELNNFTSSSFRELAATWGHPYAVILKENGYPVGISSRHPITQVHRLMTGMHHGGLYAEVNNIGFFVVHFSPFSSARRLQEAGAVLQTLQEKGRDTKRRIILGDFNAFSPYDSAFYATTGIQDSMRAGQQHNKILRNLNDNNELDYQVIRTFLQAGYYDSYALFYPEFSASYPSRAYPDAPISEKIKIDHILLSGALKDACKSTVIIKDPVTDTLSDHYPVKAVFSL